MQEPSFGYMYLTVYNLYCDCSWGYLIVGMILSIRLCFIDYEGNYLFEMLNSTVDRARKNVI